MKQSNQDASRQKLRELAMEPIKPLDAVKPLTALEELELITKSRTEMPWEPLLVVCHYFGLAPWQVEGTVPVSTIALWYDRIKEYEVKGLALTV